MAVALRPLSISSPFDDVSLAPGRGASRELGLRSGVPKSSFLAPFKLSSRSPHSLATASRKKAAWRCESRSSGSYEHIPKQFREENLKKGCKRLVPRIGNYLFCFIFVIIRFSACVFSVDFMFFCYCYYYEDVNLLTWSNLLTFVGLFCIYSHTFTPHKSFLMSSDFLLSFYSCEVVRKINTINASHSKRLVTSSSFFPITTI